ncbi:acetyl-CoA carboxylase, carboxyltransferase subunit beta [Acetobacterium wieringae]|uniref:Acetyl-coenzyme A carboxylase carboxyl transferase subunit beta n=1 Tax=Acetobacterium wieringae TaxID=52694 RepID=A0A1F2PFQ0_9FIRM|nr:acetyl-CoA carboxylase, carboxyltransferase subunit beta [Acetobacterium wieringae]MEA4806883.1 acetyl-CoA carboxylase, carboxyltransferase subunit beta [Acetobacterium wieringae]OFV69531.1 acetyl-coenzyme A carboxylase carboxyl transferase subunit beta [Acetobacterium wieringae]TYC86637.1 acetyl-CoA carboxylase carboxyltransferase subunit beta [Acetobacterium wieringae]URN86121.1 acetyl-CoA carboxylase, carboxyltransferase subunit beta [Acetobacterium wieringae]
MLSKGLFKKPKNELEAQHRIKRKTDPAIPSELCRSCPSCKQLSFTSDLESNFHVCPKCGHHFRINARQRLNMIIDQDTFVEQYHELSSTNRLGFPGYDEKLEQAALFSHENEGVIIGTGKIDNRKVALFVMEATFMMGSMGQVVGEKITLIFEYALKHQLPVIGYTVSGGARMQEGMLALMQMAKTSGAVKRHSDAGLLYLTILTDPTTGGVTASFAMEGDIILAEPEALIAFAGPRVIEQTIRQRLPKGFQRAEFLLEKGFVDAIVPRSTQKETLTQLLTLHGIPKGGDQNGSI